MLLVHSLETFGTHDGPGIRLVVFTQGCPMRCVYCQNPDSQVLRTEATLEMSSEEILERLKKGKTYYQPKGGLTLSGGEPTLQAEAVIDLLKKVKAAGYQTAIDTCGAIYNQTINELYDLADLILLDVKHIDDDWHQKVTGFSNQNALKNAEYREESGKPFWLRYVLVPGWTDQDEYLHQWADHFKDYQHLEKVEVLPYHTLGAYKFKELDRPYALAGVASPSKEEVKKACNIFSQYLGSVVCSR